MDRFIVWQFGVGDDVYLFKIQYGQIYSRKG